MQRNLVAIPALNAKSTIGRLITEIKKIAPAIDILIVDDGSTDGTRQIAELSGAITLVHDKNRGKGEALKTAFQYAISKDYDAIITMDADLQHDPSELPKFIEAFHRASADRYGVIVAPLVLGCRPIGRKMPFPRRVSNSTTSFVASLFSSTRITDSQCGYRLIPVEILKNIRLGSSHFALEPELVIKAAKQGYPIREIPIKTIYNAGPSAIRPLIDTIRFLNLLVKSLFW